MAEDRKPEAPAPLPAVSADAGYARRPNTARPTPGRPQTDRQLDTDRTRGGYPTKG